MKVTSLIRHNEDMYNYSFKLGDMIKITLSNGVQADLICVHKDCCTTLLFKDVVFTHAFGKDLPDGGCDLIVMQRFIVETIENNLPDWMIKRMVSQVQLPSYENIIGTHPHWCSPVNNDRQWDLFLKPDYKIAFGEEPDGRIRPKAYWCSNYVSQTRASCIDWIGEPGRRCASTEYIGVRPYIQIL